MNRIEPATDPAADAPRRWPREALRVLVGALVVVAVGILL